MSEASHFIQSGADADAGAGADAGPYLQEPAQNPSLGFGASDDPGGVLVHSGELRVVRTDMAIKARALGFQFVRTYRSFNDRQGPLGVGWDANCFMRLEEVTAGGDVLFHDGTGRVDRHVASGGTYVAPAGHFAKLKKTGSAFDLRFASGMKFTFDLTGRLTERRHRTGDKHTYVYTGNQLTRIDDGMGRPITLAYDGQGRLTSLTDFSGRVVQFTYDGSNRLVSVRSPIATGAPDAGNDFPGGKTEQYQYASGSSDPKLVNNLTGIVAPNETALGSNTAFLQTTYGTTGVSFDRVTSQTVGGTNASAVLAGGTLTFSYDFQPSAGPAGTISTATVVDRRGLSTVYSHDSVGHALRVLEDPSGGAFATDRTYNADGLQTALIRPLGNRVNSAYDEANPDRFQQGNLLTRTLVPDATRGATQAEIKTTYTYEPLFNQILAEVSPRGNDTTYVPQNGGSQSAARYTTTYTYDYQEATTAPAEAAEWGIAISPSLLSKGDVNGDSLTNQAMGNLVRLARPTVTLVAGTGEAQSEGSTAQPIVTRTKWNAFGQIIELENERGNITTFAYFAESDPDGDGVDIRAGQNGATGGYLRQTIEDATAGPNRKDPGAPAAISTEDTLDPRGNVKTRTDGRGLVHKYLYNALGQLVEYEAPKVDNSQSRGFLKRFEYDANNNRTAVSVQNVTTDPATHLPTIVLSHEWFRETMTYDILKQVVARTVDATRDPALPASAQPQTMTERRRYDANGNLTRIESPLAVAGTQAENVLLYTYDARDLRTASTRGGQSAGASTTTHTYDRNGNLTITTDAVNNDSTPGGETIIDEYDGYDRVRARTDRLTTRTNFLLDPDGRTIREEALGNAIVGGSQVSLARTHYLHDELGRLIQRDRELFLPTGVSLARAVSLVDGPLTPGDGKISARTGYDARSRVTFTVADTGAAIAQIYDGADRMIEKRMPVSGVLPDGGTGSTRALFVYDANRNTVSRAEDHTIVDAGNGHALVSTTVYDALNRAVQVRDTFGHTEYFEYDNRGNRVARYDARGAPLPDGGGNDRGNATRFRYDGLNRLWAEVRELTTTGEGAAGLDTSNPFNSDGLVTNITEWDPNSQWVKKIDDNNNATTQEFDPLGRVTKITRADGTFVTLTYDADDNLVSATDEDGTVHAFTYDGNGNVLSHGVTTNAARTIATGVPYYVGTTMKTYAYNGLGQLIQSTDNNDPSTAADDWGVVSKFDSLGRLVEQMQNGRAVSSGWTSTRRTELHYPNAGQDGGRVVQYAYDAVDQVVNITNPGVIALGVGWFGICLPPARIERKFDGNPVATTVQTLGEGLVDVVAHGVKGSSYVTGRNHAHQVESYESVALNSPTFDFQTIQETFSSLGQAKSDRRDISSVGFPDGGSQNFTGTTTVVHEYDGTQNIRKSTTVGGAVVANTPNAVHDPEFDGGVEGSGNRTGDPGFLYQWDGYRRMRTLLSRTPVDGGFLVYARYNYDAEHDVVSGRRVQKIVANRGVQDGTTRFYWDRTNTIEQTRDGGTETLVRQFIFGQRANDVQVMHADTDGDAGLDTVFYYLKDHNNNVTQLVASDGGVREIYRYDRKGKPEVLDPVSLLPRSYDGADKPIGNPYLFTSHHYDYESEVAAKSGHYYMKARYYDTQFGVFMSRDPLGFWGDPANFGNPFALTGNDPWNRQDPNGLQGVKTPAEIAQIEKDVAAERAKKHERNVTIDQSQLGDYMTLGRYRARFLCECIDSDTEREKCETEMRFILMRYIGRVFRADVSRVLTLSSQNDWASGKDGEEYSCENWTGAVLETVEAETRIFGHVRIYTVKQTDRSQWGMGPHIWVQLRTDCGFVRLDPWYTGYPDMYGQGESTKHDARTPNEVNQVTPGGKFPMGNPQDF